MVLSNTYITKLFFITSMFLFTFHIHGSWKAKLGGASIIAGTAGVSGWYKWKGEKTEQVECTTEKQKWLKVGDYKDGKYIQFTYDLNSYLGGVAMGNLLMLLSFGVNNVTTFEKMRASVLRPIGNMYGLYGLGFAGMYLINTYRKRIQELESAENARNFGPSLTDPFGIHSHVHSLDHDKKDEK